MLTVFQDARMDEQDKTIRPPLQPHYVRRRHKITKYNYAVTSNTNSFNLIQLSCNVTSPFLCSVVSFLPRGARSAKINDLGWPWRAIMHCVSKHMHISEPTTKIWMKIDPYYQRWRCSPMTLDFGSVRFMRIFAVVLKIYVNFPYILCLRPYITYIGNGTP